MTERPGERQGAMWPGYSQRQAVAASPAGTARWPASSRGKGGGEGARGKGAAGEIYRDLLWEAKEARAKAKQGSKKGGEGGGSGENI